MLWKILDIGLKTLCPTVEDCERQITSKTVAIVIAHLFGKWSHVTGLIDLARRKDLVVIEDCAESFHNFRYLGYPDSDVIFFSFGVIKTQTCFGGAIAKVKDLDILKEMRRLQSTYPEQSYGQYLSKILKYFVLAPYLNSPNFMKFAMATTRSVGLNHQELMVEYLRAFPGHLIGKLRLQPSVALLTFMCERLSDVRQQPKASWAVTKGDFAVRVLSVSDVEIPGSDVSIEGYWLFPIVVVSFPPILQFLL